MGFNRRKMEDERRHAAEQEAAALAQLGRLDEARAAVQAALARCPYNVGWTSNYGSIAASR